MNGEEEERQSVGFSHCSPRRGISVARVTNRQNLSEDGNKFLRFSPSIVSYFPCKEVGLGYFLSEVCGSLKWLLKFKIDLRQNEKEATHYFPSYDK